LACGGGSSSGGAGAASSGRRPKTAEDYLAEARAKQAKEKQDLAAKADACAAGNCAALTQYCLSSEIGAAYSCTEQLKAVRTKNFDAALGLYKQVANKDYSAYLQFGLWGMDAATDPKVDQTICNEITSTTWASDGDPNNGEKEDLAESRARTCERLADRLAKGDKPDLAKALELKRQSCDLRHEADPEDDCAMFHLFVAYDVKKANPALAATYLRPWCDAAKPKRGDKGAAACMTLAEVMAGSPSDRAGAAELAKKACTNDRGLCGSAMTVFMALSKEAPGEARKLADWLYANKTATDVRGTEAYVFALQQGVGGPKDPAKSAAISKELCGSLARGASMQCFTQCYGASVPAGPQRDSCLEQAKQKQQADMEAIKRESEEDVKATQAHIQARIEAGKRRREAFEASKPKPAPVTRTQTATASNDDDDDEEETPRSKKRGAKGGKSGTAGQSGNGWGMGMSRDLACADAKLKATSAAGCDNLTSAIGGAACDCSKLGIQWSCQTSVTCR
jgi:hypothetical protein